MTHIPTLVIVVPCYNEEDVFSYCATTLRAILTDLIEKGSITSNSHILFVDDGSKDKTWSMIEAAANASPLIKGLSLSHNRGHQIAVLAGLHHAKGDAVVSIDADLQDDPIAINTMVEHYSRGSDIVYGVRNDRTSDSAFKRGTASVFYGVMEAMGVQQVAHHADFRLMSRRAVDALLCYDEQSTYLRGIIPQLGFESSQVDYARTPRTAGESKYPLRKMISLALNGITSLTVAPLRIIAVTGFVISIVSILAALYAVIQKLIGSTIEGWTSLMIAIFFLGGVQMLSLGVIGEYVGKIYLETKKRPKFFISKTAGRIDE